ncbi:Type 1 glutamine amidotransferase-like domain-containing protein [Cellulomonas sp. ACRRI]|uniref:Type 1 glutamine amidotransferase-like domain-containing protein n=1 Tax=Cellulomonas sp. ACRRI TaxID=2918188 RepID=UPI001EF1AE57|nr:Type 1 glutamine amidotransferase-like domain-containing protein [Cellulomonas sp. ACRRI]MCG7288345.1 Type 1 glutamine amidotransferase-like domain-containing protein [Cellulomonas sp. ACRRI]
MPSLLLLSLGHGAVPAFLADHAPADRPLTIGYVPDAARAAADAPWAVAERDRVTALGHAVVDVRLTGATAQQVADALDGVDALYVAGGNTFALLDALRSSGADAVVAERVRRGLPYIGSSAGSIVAGPSAEPASLMDDPAEAPGLTDRRGLGLTDAVVVPHADGKLPPYPLELIGRTLDRYGSDHELVPLCDDEALLITGPGWKVVASA